MTDKLPILSGKEVVKALGKLGYTATVLLLIIRQQ